MRALLPASAVMIKWEEVEEEVEEDKEDKEDEEDEEDEKGNLEPVISNVFCNHFVFSRKF